MVNQGHFSTLVLAGTTMVLSTSAKCLRITLIASNVIVLVSLLSVSCDSNEMFLDGRTTLPRLRWLPFRKPPGR